MEGWGGARGGKETKIVPDWNVRIDLPHKVFGDFWAIFEWLILKSI